MSSSQSAAAGSPVNPTIPVVSPNFTDPRRSGASTRPPQGLGGAPVPPPPRRAWPLVLAGLIGAVVAVFALAGLFLHDGAGNGSIDTRLASVEQGLREVASRPAPVTVDPNRVEELAAKLSLLENTVTAPRPAVTDLVLANRMTMVENEAKLYGERLVDLARRADEVAAIAADTRTRMGALASDLADLKQTVARQAAATISRDEFDAAAGRLAAIERQASEITAEVARQAALEVLDRAARSALTASALRAVVERGEPFPAELAAAKMFAADPNMLAPLDSFAPTGVPSSSVLGRELSALVPAMAQAGGEPPREGTYLERLQANAERIVRIRPVDIPGDDAGAILARIELRAAQGDTAGALAEIAKLPPALRGPAQGWSVRAQAQIAALALTRRFAAETVTALGRSAP
jgi:hypothetical protein